MCNGALSQGGPMEYKHRQQATQSWTTRRDEKKRRMRLVSSWMSGPLLPREKLVESLESLIAPQDRIVLEGDNQKQADFLSRSSVKVDPKKLHDLHLIISSISRPEQLTLFELGIAKKIDFAYACPQSLRVHSCLKTVSSKSAPFTPKSRFTRVCLSTWHRKLCWFTRNKPIVTATFTQDPVQIPLSKVPRRETLGCKRVLGAATFVDRTLRFI